MAHSAATRSGDGAGALVGRKLFIVGGGSGMGQAVAQMAIKRGARVALAGRNQDKLDQVANSLEEGVLGVYPLDIADRDALEAAMADQGPYDHVVNTAADLTFKPFSDLQDAEITGMINSKLWGPINIGRVATRHLSEQGSVLFFSGVAAYRQQPGTSLVGTVNMALESLAASLAIELKPKRFNVVSPGVVDSATWDDLSEEDRSAMFEEVANSLPVGRVGQTTDLAHAALSILENGFINGTVLHVDGGGRIA